MSMLNAQDPGYAESQLKKASLRLSTSSHTLAREMREFLAVVPANVSYCSAFIPLYSMHFPHTQASQRPNPGSRRKVSASDLARLSKVKRGVASLPFHDVHHAC